MKVVSSAAPLENGEKVVIRSYCVLGVSLAKSRQVRSMLRRATYFTVMIVCYMRPMKDLEISAITQVHSDVHLITFIITSLLPYQSPYSQ